MKNICIIYNMLWGMKKGYNQLGVYKLTIKSLEYFVMTAQCHSINEAAKKLYVAQPSLTKALRNLEEELGFPLFVRSKSGIELTDAGRQILPEAKQIVVYCNGWTSLGKERVLHTLNICTHVSFPNFLLPDVVLKLKQHHPDLKINCTYNAAPEIHISANTEAPMVVILPCGHDEQYQELVKQQGNVPDILFCGEYTCLVSRESFLAGKKQVSLKELSEYYLALPEMEALQDSTTPITSLIHCIMDMSNRIVQLESVDSVIDMVRRHPETYALSFYPALFRYDAVLAGELVFIPISDFNTKSNYCLFYSRKAYKQYPYLQEVISLIRQQVEIFFGNCLSTVKPDSCLVPEEELRL